MTRVGILSAIAFLAVSGAAHAACPIAGQYAVLGKLTGAAGNYRGEAIIKDDSGDCYVRWLPPNTSEGVGTYAGNVLTVNFMLGGKPGVVRYERGHDGVLRGAFWPKGQPMNISGTETLTPRD